MKDRKPHRASKSEPHQASKSEPHQASESEPHQASESEPRQASGPDCPQEQHQPSKPEPAAAKPFLIAVITRPDFFQGEAACLEALLAAGLEKLHLRKPGATQGELEGLLKQMDSRWYSRIVLHGNEQLQPLAARYGISQMHCPPEGLAEVKQHRRRSPIALSASLHSWEEIKEVEGAGLTYVFMSPVFDSISKPGYAATPGLLRRPAGPYPCKVIGLGGVDKVTIGELVREGWDGAAVLGWIWEDPGMAVRRYEQLMESVKNKTV